MSLQKPDWFDKYCGYAWDDDHHQPSRNSIGHNQTYLIWCIKRYLKIMLHAIVWVGLMTVIVMFVLGMRSILGSPSLNNPWSVIILSIISWVPLCVLFEMMIMELDARYTFGEPLNKKQDKKEPEVTA